MASREGENFDVGQRLTVDIEKVAHGGHFIARAGGRVFFVRHGLPGEKVEIEITSVGSSFLRADVVSVLSASPDRIVSPCPFAGPGRCGGCDFQHISPTRQRELKGDVIKEQFLRIAKIDVDVKVEEVAAPTHWRTRISGATNAQGAIGFYAFRSHRVIAVDDCLIAAEGISFSDLAKRKWPVNSRVEISAGSDGARTVAIGPAVRGSKVRITQGPKILREQIGDNVLEVSQESFWQSHALAPAVLIGAIRPFVREGDQVLDLYGGVGLFSAGIRDLVGGSGSITLIESSPSAVRDAKRNFTSSPNIYVHKGDVGSEIRVVTEADLVILDPPREGAGKEVLSSITALHPRSIIYVACDPAALARDCAYLAQLGYSLASLRAFDLFPMTHHIECVAHFEASQTG
ncbi:MAG: class I SAM-dependent RNA methyltransferase [Actinobacteria bacterium]|nr:class I SAM-dependent RNA methyltransferase [Actinomycetota bacterium]